MPLVLTRKIGETIIVGNVRFTINGFNSAAVSIIIDAPADVAITREEVIDGGKSIEAFFEKPRKSSKSKWSQ